VTNAKPNSRSSTGAYAIRPCPRNVGVDEPSTADEA
jgi:hypothetical protein